VKLLDELLYYDKLDSGAFQFNDAPLSPLELVGQTFEMFRPQARGKDIRFRLVNGADMDDASGHGSGSGQRSGLRSDSIALNSVLRNMSRIVNMASKSSGDSKAGGGAVSVTKVGSVSATSKSISTANPRAHIMCVSLTIMYRIPHVLPDGHRDGRQEQAAASDAEPHFQRPEGAWMPNSSRCSCFH